MDQPEGEEQEILEGVEVISLKIEVELVPDWSNVVERIARHHGERVAVGILGDAFVVKVAVKPEKKEHLLHDVQRTWALFVERRKREGRWQA